MSGLVIGIAAAVELIFIIGLATWFIRRKRRGASADVSAAVEHLMPGPLGRIAALELEIWLAVWRLIFRRRHPELFYPASRSVLGYFTIFVVFTAPVELSLVHILIPSATIAWIVTGVSAYGIFWIVGMYASIKTTPHLIDKSGLTVRYGILGSVKIPWYVIESVMAESTKPSKPGDGLRIERTASGDYEAWLMSAGQADVTIRLRTLVRPRGVVRLGAPVRAVHVAVDRPGDFASAVQNRMNVSAT